MDAKDLQALVEQLQEKVVAESKQPPADNDYISLGVEMQETDVCPASTGGGGSTKPTVQHLQNNPKDATATAINWGKVKGVSKGKYFEKPRLKIETEGGFIGWAVPNQETKIGMQVTLTVKGEGQFQHVVADLVKEK